MEFQRVRWQQCTLIIGLTFHPLLSLSLSMWPFIIPTTMPLYIFLFYVFLFLLLLIPFRFFSINHFQLLGNSIPMGRGWIHRN